jgi:hypothetical protein
MRDPLSSRDAESWLPTGAPALIRGFARPLPCVECKLSLPDKLF